MKYRKKPVVIEAVQWFKPGDHPKVTTIMEDGKGWIETLEGGHIVTPGDFIIAGVRGEHYPCKPDIFRETYEPVEENEMSEVTRKAVDAHAAQCREARWRGQISPSYNGPSLQGADLESADLREVNLRGADLRGANLRGANLWGVNLWDVNLMGADLESADLRGADLASTILRKTNLEGADLRGANLEDADLRGANLRGANLRGANLERADLEGADLRGANLPDGRTLEQWQADPLAGLCTEPEAVRRATAAWGAKSWENCPMHAAHGWGDLCDAPEGKRLLLATFIALHDGDHLPKPEEV